MLGFLTGLWGLRLKYGVFGGVIVPSVGDLTSHSEIHVLIEYTYQQFYLEKLIQQIIII